MTAPAVRVCPQCAETVEHDEAFCPACGDFLGWREEAVAPAVVLELPPTAVEEDPLARPRQAAAAAEARAEAARAEAAQAQVRLERARRRRAAARRRVERLEAELPAAEQRARDAARAADRAAGAARRASSAAEGARGAGRSAVQRREQLRARASEAVRAEQRARTASLQAQESAATLSGVLQGARAEVATAPEAVAAAQRARDEARAAVRAAQAGATAAASELALQERLLQLRATPRRVVALPPKDERALRAAVEQDAARAAQATARLANAAERRQRRRAEREDAQRSRAEQEADERELGGVREGAGEAERAARTAEELGHRGGRAAAAATAVLPVVDEPRPTAGALEPDEGDFGAVSPVEVRRRQRSRRSEEVAPDDGPLLCGSCATGNAVLRTLCRRCGSALRPPPPPPPPPPAPRLSWWRRLLRRLGLGPRVPRTPPLVPAGARPVPGGNPDTAAAVRRAQVGGLVALRGGRLRVLAPLLGALLAVALLLGLALSPLGDVLAGALGLGRDRVVDRVGLVEQPLVPLNSRASSTARTSAPGLALDGDPATSWTSGRPPGAGERLGITLDRPADVVAVQLTSAAGRGRPRPASVTLHTVGRLPVVLRLEDTLEPQRFVVSLRGVQDLRVRLDDLYPGGGPGLSAGFAEVQLVTQVPRRLVEP